MKFLLSTCSISLSLFTFLGHWLIFGGIGFDNTICNLHCLTPNLDSSGQFWNESNFLSCRFCCDHQIVCQTPNRKPFMKRNKKTQHRLAKERHFEKFYKSIFTREYKHVWPKLINRFGRCVCVFFPAASTAVAAASIIAVLCVCQIQIFCPSYIYFTQSSNGSKTLVLIRKNEEIMPLLYGNYVPVSQKYIHLFISNRLSAPSTVNVSALHINRAIPLMLHCCCYCCYCCVLSSLCVYFVDLCFFLFCVLSFLNIHLWTIKIDAISHESLFFLSASQRFQYHFD